MSVSFSKDEISYLLDAATLVEQVYVEDRKGVSQSIYVISVDNEVFNDVPKHLLGNWMMAYPGDLSYASLGECIEDCHWVKCVEKEVVVTQWVGAE